MCQSKGLACNKLQRLPPGWSMLRTDSPSLPGKVEVQGWERPKRIKCVGLKQGEGRKRELCSALLRGQVTTRTVQYLGLAFMGALMTAAEQ